MLPYKKPFTSTVLVLGLLVLFCVSGWLVWNRIHESERWILHTNTIIERIEVILSKIQDAETAQRGYLLTGDEDYLKPYHKAFDTLDTDLRELQRASLDNPRQQQRWDVFNGVVSQKIADLEKGIEARRSRGLAGALSVFQSGTAKALMDEIRLMTRIMKGEEKQLLQMRLERRDVNMRILAVFLSIVLCALVVILGGLFIQTFQRRRVQRVLDHTSSELEQSEERYRLLVEGVKDYALYMLDVEGKVVTWTPSATRIHGYTSDEIIGTHFRRFYTDEDLLSNKPAIALQTAALDGHYQFEGWQLKKDGTPFWASALVTPIKSATGELQGYSKLVQDGTDKKKAQDTLQLKEQELHQARKMEAVGRLAGGVAHDFNNLMTGVIGLGEELLADSEVATRREDIEEIVKAAQRATHLTKQLLAFSRRQIAAPVVLNLNSLISDMQKMLRRLIGEDIELNTSLDPHIGQIKADPGQIEQIIVNLVINSKDAMKSGGKITIETMNAELTTDHVRRHFEVKPGPYVLMVVSDTGKGIDPEIQPQIFEPFFTTKAKDKGTGLGLATVYGIVKQNGGDIFLYSHPGQGTTFKIYLPRVNEPVSVEPRYTATPGNQYTGTETILIVEDEEIVRRVAKRALTARGYKVLEARNGKDALEISASYSDPIHLLLTDVVMPGLNGRQLAEMLEPNRPEMKVLYMSGYTQNIIVTRGILKSGISFLEKSFTAEILSQKVRDVLDAPERVS